MVDALLSLVRIFPFAVAQRVHRDKILRKLALSLVVVILGCHGRNIKVVNFVGTLHFHVHGLLDVLRKFFVKHQVACLEVQLDQVLKVRRHLIYVNCGRGTGAGLNHWL